MQRRYDGRPVNPRGRTAAPSMGARRSAPPKGNGNIRRWVARTCGAVVVIVAVVGVVKAAEMWSAKPVAQVAIEGTFTYISREEVAAKIYQAIDTGFIHLDLNAIRKQLEAEPWIDTASVSRRWPDGLNVTIKEHQPIARWGSVGVLNQRGEIIALADNREFTHLPLLSGPETSAGSVMQQYQALARLLRSYQLTVNGLKVDESMSWTLLLENDLPLVIGRDQIMEKVERFLVVYQHQLKQHLAEIEKIDARYSNGVAIAWKVTGKPQAPKVVTVSQRAT